jgi:phage terminase small subunit
MKLTPERIAKLAEDRRRWRDFLRASPEEQLELARQRFYQRRLAKRKKRQGQRKKLRAHMKKVWGSVELTGKQQLFCRYFVEQGCTGIAKAAERAGYAHPGPQGNVQLMNPKIQKRISEIVGPALRKYKMDADQAIKNLEKFARRNPTEDAGNDRNTMQANIEILKLKGAYAAEKIEVKGPASTGVTIDDLDLSPEEKKALLRKLREAKEKKELAAAQAQIEADEKDDEDEDEEDRRARGVIAKVG